MSIIRESISIFRNVRKIGGVSRVYLALTFLTMFGKSIIEANYVVFLLSRGLSYGDVGLILSVYFLTWAVLSFPLGVAADRYGRKLAFVTSVLLHGTGLLLYAFSVNFFQFLVAEILIAVASALGGNVLLSWYIDEARVRGLQDEVKHVMGLAKIVSAIALLLAGVSATVLVAFCQVLTFLVGGITLYLTAVLACELLRESYRSASRSVCYHYLSIVKDTARLLIRNTPLLLLMLGSLLVTPLQAAFLYSWQILVSSLSGYMPILGMTYILLTLVMMFSGTFYLLLVKIVKDITKVTVLCTAVIITISVLLSLCNTLAVLIVLLMLFKLWSSTYGTAYIFWFNELVNTSVRTAVNSLRNTLNYIVMAISLYFIGVVAEHAGISTTFLITSISGVAALPLLLLARKRN